MSRFFSFSLAFFQAQKKKKPGVGWQLPHVPVWGERFQSADTGSVGGRCLFLCVARCREMSLRSHGPPLKHWKILMRYLYSTTNQSLTQHSIHPHNIIIILSPFPPEPQWAIRLRTAINWSPFPDSIIITRIRWIKKTPCSTIITVLPYYRIITI